MKHGLRFKQPKTKAGRRDITLPDFLIDVLRDHRRAQLELRFALGAGKLDPDGLVFPANIEGKPFNPHVFSLEWATLAERNGIAVSLHALRHTHASQLIAAGVDVVTVSKRLGHASPNVTLRVYAHMFRNDDSKAAAAINAALLGKSQ